MNPVDRPLLDIGLTRLEFLRISGKGLAGLTIAPALLSLLGCKQEDIDSGTVGLINTPKGVLVTQRARCTGCHRCEISCTNFNDGSVGTFFSRIKIHRNYFFGDNGVGSGGGLYGDLNYTADTCRQCKEPQCMNVCPIGAITWQQKEGCITVDHKRCIGCSACTTACPWMMATVNTESKKSSKCVLCGECANACPTGAPCSQVIVPPQPAPAPLIFLVPTRPTEPTQSVDLRGGCQGPREGLLLHTCRCSAAEPGALTGGQVCQR